MKGLIIISLILSIFATSCTKEEIVKSKYVPEIDTYEGYQLDVLNELNAKREEYGVDPVIPEKMATALATYHATYMYNVDAISHDYFWSRYIQSQATRFGEICAYNFQTAVSEITAFESSPAHLTCMTNPHYKYCGIYKKGEYLCIDFSSYDPLTVNKTTLKINNKNKNITSIEIN
jgi:uncharacterized protein YkwD